MIRFFTYLDCEITIFLTLMPIVNKIRQVFDAGKRHFFFTRSQIHEATHHFCISKMFVTSNFFYMRHLISKNASAGVGSTLSGKGRDVGDLVWLLWVHSVPLAGTEGDARREVNFLVKWSLLLKIGLGPTECQFKSCKFIYR